ncbi:NADH:ubiquinone oxidoreductase, partial [Clostridioides difficile]
LWDVLNKKEKTIVVQVAPAVRVAIGEEFGLEPGSISTGKMVAALKALGFEHVFDTNFGADFTIMEEATEFIERIQKGENLPILTSCCPAWVNFLEHNYPDKLNLASSCKSPQGMFGSIAKNYYAPKILGINPEELYVVSVMPCVAKKYEASREELSESGILDVDLSITTRELAKMIKEAAIDLPNLQDQDFDNPLGKSTGAASIFGASGGVLEAALRTSYEKITNKTLDNVNFTNVRGLKGIREASIDVDGTTVNVCIVNTLKNARKIMDKVRSGECKYHIIEVMACPGGCVGGAGQPYHHGNTEIVDRRANALYEIDRNKAIRKSHENPDLQAIYKDFFGEPNSDVAHKYLHTHYFDKSCVYGECPQECACEEAK